MKPHPHKQNKIKKNKAQSCHCDPKLWNAECSCLLGSTRTEGTYFVSIKSCQGSNFPGTATVCSPKARQYRFVFYVFEAVTEVSPAEQYNWAMISGAEGWLYDRVIGQSSNFPVITSGLCSPIIIILTSLCKYRNKFRDSFSWEGSVKPICTHSSPVWIWCPIITAGSSVPFSSGDLNLPHKSGHHNFFFSPYISILLPHLSFYRRWNCSQENRSIIRGAENSWTLVWSSNGWISL